MFVRPDLMVDDLKLVEAGALDHELGQPLDVFTLRDRIHEAKQACQGPLDDLVQGMSVDESSAFALEFVDRLVVLQKLEDEAMSRRVGDFIIEAHVGIIIGFEQYLREQAA